MEFPFAILIPPAFVAAIPREGIVFLEVAVLLVVVVLVMTVYWVAF